MLLRKKEQQPHKYWIEVAVLYGDELVMTVLAAFEDWPYPFPPILGTDAEIQSSDIRRGCTTGGLFRITNLSQRSGATWVRGEAILAAPGVHYAFLPPESEYVVSTEEELRAKLASI